LPQSTILVSVRKKELANNARLLIVAYLPANSPPLNLGRSPIIQKLYAAWFSKPAAFFIIEKCLLFNQKHPASRERWGVLKTIN